MSRRPLRFSLVSLLLIVGFICVSVSHLWLSWNTKQLQEENRRQARELGYLTIDDPDKAYVRRVASTDGSSFKCRVYLPPGRRYALHRASSWFGNGFSRDCASLPLVEIGDPSEIVLSVSVQEVGGDWYYSIRGPRGAVGERFEMLGPVYVPREHEAQQELDPKQPMELFRWPVYSARSKATEGVLIWISPLDENAPKAARWTGTWGPTSDAIALEPDRAAAIAVTRLGGMARRDEQGYLNSVTLQYVPIVDQELAPLAGLAKIERLFVFKTQVTDAGLEHIEGLTSLRSLTLSRSNISDAGLASLHRLTELEKLNLSRTRVTDAGLEQLQDMTNLRELILTSNNISDDGLARLDRMTGMRHLWLGNTRIGGPGLKYVAAMKHLDRLFLGNTQVDDEGVKHLAALSELGTLYLDGTRVTDAGLVHLRGLPRLRTLNLARCQITDAGLRSLGSLRRLADLDLSDTAVTSADLTQLAELKNLRVLKLNGTKLSDDALPTLLALSRLERLSVADTHLTDAAAEELSKVPGLEIHRVDRIQEAAARKIDQLGASSFVAEGKNVTKVTLSGPQVTNAALSHLEPLVELVTLSIFQTKLTELALDDIARLPKLRALELHGMLITDKWLQRLAELEFNLEELVLKDVRISDDGLQHLRTMNELERLEINDAQITDTGLTHLEGMANLQVYLLRTRATSEGTALLRQTVRYVEHR